MSEAALESRASSSTASFKQAGIMEEAGSSSSSQVRDTAAAYTDSGLVKGIPKVQTEDVETILARNRRVASPFLVAKCEREAAKNWDRFYRDNADRFFKDKNWTDREFEELRAEGEDDPSGSDDVASGLAQSSGAAPVLLEVGCGPGNMLYPALSKKPELKAHACDFSARAVDLVKANPLYDTARINAFVHDLASPDASQLSSTLASHAFGRPTIVSLIFVLSAIPAAKHRDVLRALVDCLPSGGTLVFRDFAHGDLTQLRYHLRKTDAWREPSLLIDGDKVAQSSQGGAAAAPEEQAQEAKQGLLYRRGDGTMTYYFSVKELEIHAQHLGLEGEVKELLRFGLNRRTGQELSRRFVQARWRKL